MPTCARTLRDATIVIKDGTTTPNTITLVCDGALSYRVRRQDTVASHRGVLDRFVKGPEVPVDISFQIRYQVLSYSTVTVSPYDALLRKGVAAAWVSTSTVGDVYTCQIQVTITDPSGGSPEVVTFAKFRVGTIEFSEGEDGDFLFVTGTDLETQPTSAK